MLANFTTCLAIGGELLLIGVGGDVPISPMTMISKMASVKGWSSGTAIDSEDTMNFAVLNGTRPMVETYPIEKVQEAWDSMMTNKARFRPVLKFH